MNYKISELFFSYLYFSIPKKKKSCLLYYGEYRKEGKRIRYILVSLRKKKLLSTFVLRTSSLSFLNSENKISVKKHSD